MKNVLASRYASTEMNAVWSPERRIVKEREFWIAVMRAQQSEGFPISDEAISAYEAAKQVVNLDAIASRERVTRHDVKARIEEFNSLAGYEDIHKGMTSRDLTENVEQMLILESLDIVTHKAVAASVALAEAANKWKSLVITGRSHNVAAQPTTLGKRFAMFGESFLYAINKLEFLRGQYPLRGLKGAVGTCQDQLTLFDGDDEKLSRIEDACASHLGCKTLYNAVGQVYPRTLDFDVISSLFVLASGAADFSKNLRIMAGYELMGEGFAPGQVGSSAMPHKMNARSSERITGFHTLLRGYVTTAAGLAGDQWNEGDVSCSVVRRVLLPDAFFCIDGILETLLVILKQMEIYEHVFQRENEYYFPFLCTTTVLMEAVKAGGGREQVHKAVKNHAIATLRDLRNGSIKTNDLMDRLAADEQIPLDEKALSHILENAETLTGCALTQVEHFVDQVYRLAERFPEAAHYSAGSIL